MRKLFGVVAALLLVAGSAGAQVTTYSSGTYNGGGGDGRGFNNVQTATSFTLPTEMRPTSISIPVFYWTYGDDPFGGMRGAFDWFVYTDASGSPGSLVASGSGVPTSLNAPTSSSNVWTVMTDGAPVLGAGTQYWLALDNTGPNVIASGSGMYWRNTWCSTQVQHTGVLVGGQWVIFGDSPYALCNNSGEPSSGLSFQFAGVAPEPTQFALLGTGLLGIIPFARRKRIC